MTDRLSLHSSELKTWKTATWKKNVRDKPRPVWTQVTSSLIKDNKCNDRNVGIIIVSRIHPLRNTNVCIKCPLRVIEIFHSAPSHSDSLSYRDQRLFK